MSGDWIKMRKSLLTCPQVVRIMSALKADRFRTVGGLFSAWCLLDEQTTDGRLEGYTPEVFDEMVGFPGLARAMERVGWLEIGPDSISAPRFFEHNGKTAKRRAAEAVRKMSARNADKCPQPMRTESAIEKRREEKSKNNTNTPLPPNLETDAFKVVWLEYISHRGEKRNKLTPTGQKRLLSKLAGWGPERAIAAIQHSVANGWAGVFEPDEQRNGKQKMELL